MYPGTQASMKSIGPAMCDMHSWPAAIEGMQLFVTASQNNPTPHCELNPVGSQVSPCANPVQIPPVQFPDMHSASTAQISPASFFPEQTLLAQTWNAQSSSTVQLFPVLSAWQMDDALHHKCS
jgi:hypothetical protein